MLDKTETHRRIETPDMKDYGVYLDVDRLLDLAVQRLPMERVAFHLHDTHDLALANIMLALEAGVAVFDGANGHFCAGWDLQFGAQMAKQEGGAGVLAGLEFMPDDVQPAGPMGPSRLLLS